MKGKTVNSSLLERMLAPLGLLFILLLGWACDQQAWKPHPHRRRARWLLAYLVIESVTAIGSAIDHFALVRVSGDRTGLAGDPKMQGDARR